MFRKIKKLSKAPYLHSENVLLEAVHEDYKVVECEFLGSVCAEEVLG